MSEKAGEVWFAASVMSALMLFGLAVFLFFFGLIPYWFKLHKHLREILGCAYPAFCGIVLACPVVDSDSRTF